MQKYQIDSFNKRKLSRWVPATVLGTNGSEFIRDRHVNRSKTRHWGARKVHRHVELQVVWDVDWNKAELVKGAALTQQTGNRPFTEVLPSGFSSFAKQNPRTHLWPLLYTHFHPSQMVIWSSRSFILSIKQFLNLPPSFQLHLLSSKWPSAHTQNTAASFLLVGPHWLHFLH